MLSLIFHLLIFQIPGAQMLKILKKKVPNLASSKGDRDNNSAYTECKLISSGKMSRILAYMYNKYK